MHHKSQRMKSSHAHLRDDLPFHSLQVQIILLAALKMRMMLVMWQVNSHNPLSGHCPLNPKGIWCTPLLGPPTGDCGILAQAGHEPRPSMPVARPAQASTNIGRLDTISTGLTVITQNANVVCVQ